MSTQFRHPATVVDEVIADLGYLTEFFLDDIDHGALRNELLSARAMKAVAALEATRMLLPRLRIVRSNFVADSRLPDTSAGAGLLQPDIEPSSDASETPTATGNDRLVR